MNVKTVSVQQNNASIIPQFQSQLKHMDYKAMKKAAIIRGMKPRHVIKADYFKLLGFINENFFKETDDALLIKFDNWVERKTGKALEGTYSALKMSYMRDKTDEEVEVKSKAKKKKREKVKRVKNKYGIIEGTKKALVYELVEKSKSPASIIKRTIKRFPDARESSIKIWINQARKAIKG